MTAIGGPLQSVTLDGRNFAVAADAEIQRKVGGFENEVQANGDATSRMIKTPVPWMLGGIMVSVDDIRGDHEYLQELANRSDYFPIAATYTSGAIWQGEGQITGELQFSNQSSTASVELSGEGVLSQQV